MPSAHRLVAAAVALAAALAPAVPKPGYYHPSSVQAGATTRVIMGGDAVWGVQGAWVSGGGVKVTRIVPVPGFPRAAGRTERPFVRTWLYDLLEDKLPTDKRHRKLPPEATIKETDWEECAWWFFLDALDNLELQIVARDLYTPESYPQDTPALNKLLILDVEVDADAKPGRRDIFLYDNASMSAPHPFYITKEPHVCEPFFVFPPRDKHIPLPHVLHLPPDLKPHPLPVHLDGQIWPGEVDGYTLRLEEGQQLVCSLLGRELCPYLGDAVPGYFNPVLRLYDSRGKEVAFADDFYYLPDPVLTYKVPEDGFYILKVHDNLFRGGPNFVYSVFCRDARTDRPLYAPRDRAFACYPQPASFVPPKAAPGRIVRKGSIDIPGRVDRHTFTVKEPGTWHFELYARREGSPLDGVLQLYGPMGDLPLSVAPLLATWDDAPGRLFVEKNVGSDDLPIIKKFMLYEGSIPQAECDPSGTFTFETPGTYCVTVADQPGLGGEHYDYTLVIAPAEPSFEVFALESACLVRNGTARFTACVLRKDGFAGDIAFDSTDDYEVSGGFSGDEREVDVSISFGEKMKWTGLTNLQLTASGELPSGKTLTVRVTPTDPAEQAFAYSHLLPARGFTFGVAEARTREDFKHAGPHLTPVKTQHSGGKSCISCHDKKKAKSHNKGKACNECHQDKE